MSGIELRDGTLVVDRKPNDLDDLALRFSSILDDLDIDHVFVSGYVAILSGRSRATEDIDVLLARVGDETISALADRLASAGLWGPAMPLDTMVDQLNDGANIWVARDDEMVPHLEVKFVDDEFDRASLQNRITAELPAAAESLPIGPLELQIAYKLYLGAQKDFEDAVHLYTLFEESLSRPRLEQWVRKLGVEDDYDRLKQA